MTGKTTGSQLIWSTPDGSRTIYTVYMEIDGKPQVYKTYSGAVAEAGFEGDIETYEKDGRQGKETFVRQVEERRWFWW